jgi:hypothetical protein
MRNDPAQPEGNLIKVQLQSLQRCHWHPKVIASYDVRTWNGLWAYACIKCFPIVAARPELGTGWGQMIEYAPGTEGLADKTDVSTDEMVEAALREGVNIGGLPELVLHQIARHATHVIMQQRRSDEHNATPE